MALTVVIRSADTDPPASITFDAPRIVIGRGEGCEVRLPDPSVSHRHASIRQRGSDYVVVDEGSTNGTFVGPVRLSPQAPRVLRANDFVRVGRVWLEIRVEQAVPTANPQATTREIALGLVASAFAAQGEPLAARVRVDGGPDAGRELLLSDFERAYVAGRAPNVELVLSEPDASRRHVEFRRRGAAVYVRDLGAKNGSTLGGERLPKNGEQRWDKGAVLCIGGTTLSLEDPLLSALGELEASADEVMRADESVDPPPSSVEEPPPAPESRNAAPLADVPRSEGPPAARRKSGIALADFLVAALALVVLSLSLLGLAWVLRSD